MKTKLRSWRKSRGLTQTDVAQMLGVSTGQVSHYELGRFKMPAEKAVKLAKMTGEPAATFRPDLFGLSKKRVEAA